MHGCFRSCSVTPCPSWRLALWAGGSASGAVPRIRRDPSHDPGWRRGALLPAPPPRVAAPPAGRSPCCWCSTAPEEREPGSRSHGPHGAGHRAGLRGGLSRRRRAALERRARERAAGRTTSSSSASCSTRWAASFRWTPSGSTPPASPTERASPTGSPATSRASSPRSRRWRARRLPRSRSAAPRPGRCR